MHEQQTAQVWVRLCVMQTAQVAAEQRVVEEWRWRLQPQTEQQRGLDVVAVLPKGEPTVIVAVIVSVHSSKQPAFASVDVCAAVHTAKN